MNALLTNSPKRRLLREPASNNVEICLSKFFEMPQDDCDCSIEGIHARAKAVTPLLEEILNTHPPIHWGINE